MQLTWECSLLPTKVGTSANALYLLGLLQRSEIFDEINEVLRRHVLLETSRHDGEFHLVALKDVALFVTGDDAPDGFDGDLVGSVAGDEAEGFVTGFELDLKGFVAEGDARAGIEDGFVKGIFAEFIADFAEVGAEVHALALDAM